VGNISINVYTKFRCSLLRIEKAFWGFLGPGELIPTTRKNN